MLRDRILVEPVKKDTCTDSGIALRYDDYIKPTEGIIVSVGEDVTSVRSGDHIIFDKFAGSQVYMNGKDMLIMSFRDVAAVID